jgi:hypothetical protein
MENNNIDTAEDLIKIITKSLVLNEEKYMLTPTLYDKTYLQDRCSVNVLEKVDTGWIKRFTIKVGYNTKLSYI